MKKLVLSLAICFGLVLGGVVLSPENAAYACGDKDKSSDTSDSGSHGEST